MVGGEVALDIPGPGFVIGIIFHELALPVKVPALPLKAPVLVLVERQHLPDFLRDRLVHHRPPFPPGQRGIPVHHLLLYGGLVQNNRRALLPAGGNCPVQQPEDRFGAVHFLYLDPDPFLPLHPEGGGQAGYPPRKGFPPTFDVAPLDFHSGVKIPLPHQKGDPFPGIRVGQDGKTGEFGPFVLFPHPVFLFGIRRQFGQFHTPTPFFPSADRAIPIEKMLYQKLYYTQTKSQG